MPFEHVGAPNQINDACGECLRGLGLRHPALNDRELVAAGPGDQRVLTAGIAQALSDLAQQRVADGMAERVVDRLEAVEIDVEHRHRPVIGPDRLLHVDDQRDTRQGRDEGGGDRSHTPR